MTHYHFVGIGGTGLAPIARILLEQGNRVSGSDRVLSPLTDELAALGAQLYTGHDASHLTGVEVVIRSSAIPDSNPEVQAAHDLGIPVLKRADFLGTLTAEKKVIGVAGTHGKTTTTAMIAWILSELGQQPSFVLGSTIKNLSRNAQAGKGAYFVIEADEYDRMFLGLKPAIEIITYVEHDHPDCFPTFQDYVTAFQSYVKLLQPGGILLLNHDQIDCITLKESLPHGCQVFTFGILPDSDYQAVEIHPIKSSGYQFMAFRKNTDQKPTYLATVELKVPGLHNVRNALAALALTDQLGLPLGQSATALGNFLGTGRRFELRGVQNGIAIIDDYAHHPTEIQATLQAARSSYPEARIWVVWQPHTYSRLQALQQGFNDAFTEADHVIITEVYAAREQNEGFSMAEFSKGIHHPHLQFIPNLADASCYLLDYLKSGDVLLVLSAGDADRISTEVLEGLTQKEIHNG